MENVSWIRLKLEENRCSPNKMMCLFRISHSNMANWCELTRTNELDNWNVDYNAIIIIIIIIAI